MAVTAEAAINAPRDNRAVIVLPNGVTVSLRLKSREDFSVKRTVTQGKLETGYKISDGTVNDPKVISIEGIITGADFPHSFGLLSTTQNPIFAMNQAQQITAAYDADELVSVYLSFMALPQSVMTSLNITAEPKSNALTVKLTAQRVDFVTFQRSRSIKAQQTKTSSTAGKGTVSAGKKSATPVDAKKEPQKVFALEKLRRLAGVGERA